MRKILGQAQAWTITAVVLACAAGASGEVLGQEADAVRAFDTVEIWALIQVVEIPKWKKDAQPPMSPALEKVVLTRPISLLALEGGKSWRIRPSNSSKMERLDPAKLPLGPADLQCVENLLKLPYVAKWTHCMRQAWNGQAPQNCLKELAELAHEQPPEIRKKLQANLGGRLQALAPRNKEWADLVFADNAPEPVREALASYRQVEQEKVAAVLEFGTGNDSINEIAFAAVPESGKPADETLSWHDFAQFDMGGGKPTSNRFITWKPGKEHTLEPVYSQKAFTDSKIGTLILSGDQHLIIRGKLDESRINSLKQAKTVDQVLKQAKDLDCEVFLSRPGSATLGVVK